MANEKLAIISRVSPSLHKASQLYEQAQGELSVLQGHQASLIEAARKIGELCDEAAISLEASKVGVSFREALQAHAPNIPIKFADKCRRLHRGEFTDTRQFDFPFYQTGTKPRQIADKTEHKPSQLVWVKANVILKKFEDMFDVEVWPNEQIEIVEDELRRIIRIIENHYAESHK